MEVLAKREDCNSGIAFGGNKVRKLEYLVADALQQGCDTLVSIGGVQSNHTRQVTGVARYLGLGAVTVQEDWVDWPESAYDKVGNIQLTRILVGGIRMDPAGFDIGIRDSWRRALESIEAAGAKPYAIPAGHPTTRSAAWDSPTGSGRGPSGMSAATDHPYPSGYRIHLDHVAVGDQPHGIGCPYDSRYAEFPGQHRGVRHGSALGGHEPADERQDHVVRR